MHIDATSVLDTGGYLERLHNCIDVGIHIISLLTNYQIQVVVTLTTEHILQGSFILI